MNGLCIIFVALLAVDVDQAATKTAATKPWLSDFAGFVSAHPNGHYLVAQSGKPAISAAEAQTGARQCAVEALAGQVQARVHGQISMKDVRRHVDASLVGDGWIVDRQLESVERPYGTIWREAILIDASPKKLDALSNRLQSIVRQQQQKRVLAGVGGSVLLVVVSLGYIVLNWLTRGYLRLRLAMTSLLIAGGGIALIAHLV
jgi:hypothetical protein